MRTDERTHTHTLMKLAVAFRNFENAPGKISGVHRTYFQGYKTVRHKHTQQNGDFYSTYYKNSMNALDYKNNLTEQWRATQTLIIQNSSLRT